jgi:hypothetical protein
MLRRSLLPFVGIVLSATAVTACGSETAGSGDNGGDGALNRLDVSAAGVADLCRTQIDDAVQAIAPTLFTFASARPGAGRGTNCFWDGPGRQKLAAEFFLFPFTETNEDGKEVEVDGWSFERDHRDGYRVHPHLAATLGVTGVYTWHVDDYHTMTVFDQDRAVLFTTIGPVALSDSQLKTLALSLDD